MNSGYFWSNIIKMIEYLYLLPSLSLGSILDFIRIHPGLTVNLIFWCNFITWYVSMIVGKLAEDLHTRIFTFPPDAGWLQSLDSSPSTLLFVRCLLCSLSSQRSPFSSFFSLRAVWSPFSAKSCLSLFNLFSSKFAGKS